MISNRMVKRGLMYANEKITVDLCSFKMLYMLAFFKYSYKLSIFSASLFYFLISVTGEKAGSWQT